MKAAEIKQKAADLGIDPANMKKAELILAIQEAEGVNRCFGTNKGDCPYEDCCFWDDCIKEARKKK